MEPAATIEENGAPLPGDGTTGPPGEGITGAAAEGAGLFEVSLELFDGPIDLLLHLVKRQELPIERVSLAAVTERYLRCIEDLGGVDFETAGEYLVIAATLLAVKAAVILREPAELGEGDEEEGEDPAELLLLRLRELEAFRSSAAILAARGLLGTDVFAPRPAVGAVVVDDVLGPHDPVLLGRALKRLMAKKGVAAPFVVRVDPVSIADRMAEVVTRLREAGGPLSFEEAVGADADVAAVIACFVALLELCKRAVISAVQDEAFGEIRITLVAADVRTEEFDSEFDAPEEKSGEGRGDDDVRDEREGPAAGA